MPSPRLKVRKMYAYYTISNTPPPLKIYSGVSWVWLAIAILVKVKCTLRGLMLRFWAIWGDLGLHCVGYTPSESHGICNRHG
eukprot:COSAG05_NODE_1043_length_6061_cov_10.071285_6_plen_82_part_00